MVILPDWVWPLAFAMLGVSVGSFINVVAHRLPVMMRLYEDRSPAGEPEAGTATMERAAAGPFDLIRPRSFCPRCGTAIAAWDNVPIISFLVLRGRCRACRAPIPWQYPLVELTGAVSGAGLALIFGPGWPLAGALVFTWALVAVTLIDARHMVIPDSVTLPLLWLGLLANAFGLFTTAEAAIIGAAAGYGVFWAVQRGLRVLWRKEALGHGDLKLFAALGAWLGWDHLPLVLLLASAVGATTGIMLLLTGAHARGRPLPFGPFLALAGVVALVWGDAVWAAYWDLVLPARGPSPAP